jgi:hypothetical protein
VLHLGASEDGTIESVGDGGHTLVVNGDRYTLRRVNARYVRDGEPWYGTRLAIGPDEDLG